MRRALAYGTWIVLTPLLILACGSSEESPAASPGETAGAAGTHADANNTGGESGASASGGEPAEGGSAGAGDTGGVGGASGNGGEAGNGSSGDGGDGGSPAADPACAGGGPTPPPSDALLFDGVDDYVAMGVAPQLGLAEFTLEAWVRRDGPGVVASTGANGVSATPVIAKGLREDELSTGDGNYFLGFTVEGALSVDFEDTATSDNHPLEGNTPLPLGEWHHIAATFDGHTWRLYLDGNQDAALTAQGTPRQDSIQHFALGSAVNTLGVPEGAFHGALDEVRIWNYARSADEVRAGQFVEMPSASGLVSRFALDAADGGALDSAGTNDGILMGEPEWAQEGGRFLGLAAGAANPMPPHEGVSRGAGGTVKLSVQVIDPEDQNSAVTFHIRETYTEPNFVVAVLPDTRILTKTYPQHFTAQTRWIMENREARNIQAVVHNGDIVEGGNVNDNQWIKADAAMSLLEASSTDFPDGLPYQVAVGSQDMTNNDSSRFNKWFGVSRFEGRSYYGGHYGSDNDNSFMTFSAGGADFLVLTVRHAKTNQTAVLNWAREQILAHPDHHVLLNVHQVINETGAWVAQGEFVHDAVKDLNNVDFIVCGHQAGETERSYVFDEHEFATVFAGYDGEGEGGDGWLRLWEFSPMTNEVTIETYSPVKDAWGGPWDRAPLTLPIDFTGDVPPFRDEGTVDPVGSPQRARTTVAVESGKEYEWYVTVDDCAHVSKSPVWTFQVE
jgi:hypothetical protein